MAGSCASTNIPWGWRSLLAILVRVVPELAERISRDRVNGVVGGGPYGSAGRRNRNPCMHRFRRGARDRNRSSTRGFAHTVAERTQRRRIYVGTAGWWNPRAQQRTIARARDPIFSATRDCSRARKSIPPSTVVTRYQRTSGGRRRRLPTSGLPSRFRDSSPTRTNSAGLVLRSSDSCETDGLGARRGPLLVQLPPSFAFEARVAERFFEMVWARFDGLVVCEPRHPTWFAAAGTGAVKTL